jgi:hypothetical protein
MYNKDEFNELMKELHEMDQLLKPDARVIRMKSVYTVEPDQAITLHLDNMIETYGIERVLARLKTLVEVYDANKAS